MMTDRNCDSCGFYESKPQRVFCQTIHAYEGDNESSCEIWFEFPDSSHVYVSGCLHMAMYYDSKLYPGERKDREKFIRYEGLMPQLEEKLSNIGYYLVDVDVGVWQFIGRGEMVSAQISSDRIRTMDWKKQALWEQKLGYPA